MKNWFKDNWDILAALLALFLIAFGVNWMAYEQRRANSGFFIAPPTQQELEGRGAVIPPNYGPPMNPPSF